MRILVADDETEMTDVLEALLSREHYAVDIVHDGQDALDYGLTGNYDCLVLDIMMPVLDGLETCRLIRKRSAVPVMIVTARDAEADELVGFHCGADDFIAKPLRFPVFIARVKALLKRTSTVTELAAGGITINTAAHTVKAGAAAVSLTPREYELLLYLAQHLGRARTRQQILQDVWKSVNLGEARTVDTHIKNLRMKLGQCGAQLKTIRGSGYLLEA